MLFPCYLYHHMKAMPSFSSLIKNNIFRSVLTVIGEADTLLEHLSYATLYVHVVDAG